MLNTNVFTSIIEEFGQPEIELFASSENKHWINISLGNQSQRQ